MKTKDLDRLARGPGFSAQVPFPLQTERCPRCHSGAGDKPCLLCNPAAVPVEFGGRLVRAG